MGRIANIYLAKLWDFMVFYNLNSGDHSVDILEAFLECDEALSELQDERDHWKTMYSNACGDQDVLKESIRLLDTENRRLKEERDRKAEAAVKLAKRRDELLEENSELKERYQGLRKRHTELFAADNRTIDQLREENESLKKEYKSLQGLNVDIITKHNEEMNQLRKDKEALASAVNGKDDELQVLKKECDELKKDCEYMTNSRNAWRSRALEAEKRVGELLPKKYDQAFEDLRKERDRYSGLYTELKKDYDRLFEENRSLKSKIIDFKKRITELQNRCDNLERSNKALRNVINSVYGTTTRRLADALRKNGMYELWRMLQEVGNSTYSECLGYFQDVCSIDDLVEWDLEDFLNEYNEWQKEKEQNETDRMRNWLADFCYERVCKGCPLESNEYKCGCGYSFKKSADRDMRIIPDEELERYYEKARGCGAYNLKDGKLFIHDLSHPMARVNEAIKNSCDRFTKAVEAANINIFTRAWHGDATAEKIKIEPWSYTLEGTINVEFDRDLLEKVCGVKPDDKK